MIRRDEITRDLAALASCYRAGMPLWERVALNRSVAGLYAERDEIDGRVA
jgi:hypothetical protein